MIFSDFSVILITSLPSILCVFISKDFEIFLIKFIGCLSFIFVKQEKNYFRKRKVQVGIKF